MPLPDSCLPPVPDILIAGAGPTDLALACLLARQGLRIRIVEKKFWRSQTPKAIGLQYRVSEVLASMDIVDRFLSRGGSPTTVSTYLAEKKLVALKFQATGQVSVSATARVDPVKS